ncbi:nickel import ATP-binding protein NikE [Treponema primitia ZAS-2]|uniref:Nickel import ATP-binding protein NikE n=1 Tax=Treponema primitia (strain ATCC BAA-887 / DSM 12427 / ZAS-2) TaxID=545694 RepID=F5YKV5_TREPZ|nr:ATP-binding cassette domain-containing protein [Treponema primitia]AEF86673.1 nickel import ATP-binding protein NikE [Treponema primitia ZAS-2]
MSTLFEARNISFGYDPKKLVLDRVSITIGEGERVGIIGPSGCGKSTLARIMGGYIASQSPGNSAGYTGEILFEGKPLAREGYCPVQLVYQHPERAVNPRWKMGRTLTEAWQLATKFPTQPDEALLRTMGIEREWFERYPAELSGGEIQRFCLARALGPRTRIILADEISTMLDVITQAQIWQALLAITAERGLGLLVITHNPHLAEKICSRILKFEDLKSVEN